MRFPSPRRRLRPVTGLVAAVAAACAVGAVVLAPANAAPAASGGSLTLVKSSSGLGPNKVSVVTASNLADHTIYLPADLSRVSTMPVVAWGEGGCSDSPASTEPLLSELASWGFLVVADGKLNGFGSESVSELKAGIDWAVSENSATGPLAGRINTSKIAVGGFSCGGLLAIYESADPRVTTTVMMSSGLFGDRPQVLGKLHAPIVYVEGGTNDIAYANGAADFKALPAKLPAAFASLKGWPHGGSVPWQPHGGQTVAAIVAWLKWQLQGDQTAKAEYVGPRCGLCTDSRWALQTKNLS